MDDFVIVKMAGALGDGVAFVRVLSDGETTVEHLKGERYKVRMSTALNMAVDGCASLVEAPTDFRALFESTLPAQQPEV